jgi:hypothetical protein
MRQEAKLSPGQEPQVRMIMAKLGYKQGKGGIYKGPSETNFMIGGKHVGRLAKTDDAMVLSCEEKITPEFIKEMGLVFYDPQEKN